MYRKVCSVVHVCFISLFMIGLSPVFGQQQEESIVHLVYFLPSDREPEPDINVKMDQLIKDVQKFYANQMEVHGFGRKTFIFQTDASGNAVVHHIRGKFPAAYYEHGTYVKVGEEIVKQFDLAKSIYFTLVDSGYLINGGPGVASKGHGYGGGMACINNLSSLDKKVLLSAHELGHTFGLGHDFRDKLNIMSGGWVVTHSGQPIIPVGLSKCTAEFLDVHRYFNAGHQIENVSNNSKINTKIQMLTPIADPANAIRLRFEITDVDGLHQARLYGGTSVTIGCQRLTGNSNSIVEFTTTTVTPRNGYVDLDVIDVYGNISSNGFFIDVPSLLPSKVVSIPDVNLAAAVRKALNLAPGDALTTLLMLELSYLDGLDDQITDLTGLEYAINLTLWLNLAGNTISDVSPISGLTKLTTLHLYGNTITDIAPLSGLTQLRMLHLSNNNISDVSALTGLARLAHLNVERNPLSYASIHTHIPALQAKGVEVKFDNRAHSALVKISGDTQGGEVGTALANPFVVEALDEYGAPITGLGVTFRVIEGNGQLSAITAITDTTGKAEKTLTLGPNPGVIKVRVTAAGITYPVTFTATATEASKRASDVNGDGVVNIQDLVLVSSSFGQTGENAADVNGDGVVNIQDLVQVAAQLGTDAAAPSAWGHDGEAAPTRTQVEQWLAEARQLNLTEATSHSGIRFLESLLVMLTPQETALLANYPNPFNPESWIPYQLATPADVTLQIHAIDGSLIRTLSLGHKAIGTYQTRSRAAYWDGKNQIGEPIASGVYFYTLTAGDFNATRKMLIRK
ncbi:leucine-rich repeat domain-containing protein [Candidatus Poribacteria bacterium]|nr:leucine-rich repeat domain-containing protein [Candidatus Poribacteria bacterium]